MTMEERAMEKRQKKIKRDECIIAMYNAGAPLKEIMRVNSISIGTIKLVRDRNRIPLRPAQVAPVRKNRLEEIDNKLTLICQKLGIEV